MANLARRDPTLSALSARQPAFNDLFDFRRSFDQIINRMLDPSASTVDQLPPVLVAVPPIEAYVDGDGQYHLSVAIPGVNPDEIQLTLLGNDLTVSGEHEAEDEKKDADFSAREFSYERFQRTITLPEGVEADKLTAEYKSGVLEITAPLKASARPKRIEVQPSHTQQTGQTQATQSAPKAKTASASGSSETSGSAQESR